MKTYRKIDIYRKLEYSANSNYTFDYYKSSTRYKTCKECIKALNINMKYIFTKNGKDYFSDGVYCYVAYLSK